MTTYASLEIVITMRKCGQNSELAH